MNNRWWAGARRCNAMKLLPLPLHHLFEYFLAVLLLVTPWALGFADGSLATLLLLALGLVTLFVSVANDCEAVWLRLFPMRFHLAVDVVSGVLLAASPWLFGFADRVAAPHVAVGLAKILMGLFTRPEEPALRHFDAKYASVYRNTPLRR